jgi:hypothetical protein
MESLALSGYILLALQRQRWSLVTLVVQLDCPLLTSHIFGATSEPYTLC